MVRMKKSVRANVLGLKLIKVWCRLKRKKKESRGDEYERNNKKDGDDSKILVKNRLILFGKWFWMFWFRFWFGLVWCGLV